MSHDELHIGEEKPCLHCLQAQVVQALEIAQAHGPEHRNEGADPLPGESQTKTTAGTPTHRAPEGTRCWVIPDNQAYINSDGGTGWTLLETGGTGAPKGADYLVGTANADLTNEIVVGTTPGGELGNTWPSPTVDATHSGSAHHTKYTDAEAIAAVEGEATLDLAGDVTIDGAKSLKVDVIDEKDAAAGVRIESVTIRDGYAEIAEIATPGNPASNSARLFLRDNGDNSDLVLRSAIGNECTICTITNVSAHVNKLPLNWIE